MKVTKTVLYLSIPAVFPMSDLPESYGKCTFMTGQCAHCTAIPSIAFGPEMSLQNMTSLEYPHTHMSQMQTKS